MQKSVKESRFCVTLKFDLLVPKVESFMPLPHGPLMPICIKIDPLVLKMSCSQVWLVENIMPLASLGINARVKTQQIP